MTIHGHLAGNLNLSTYFPAKFRYIWCILLLDWTKTLRFERCGSKSPSNRPPWYLLFLRFEIGSAETIIAGLPWIPELRWCLQIFLSITQGEPIPRYVLNKCLFDFASSMKKFGVKPPNLSFCYPENLFYFIELFQSDEPRYCPKRMF